MGLTWLFGLLALANDSVALQYLFTVFNVFQVGPQAMAGPSRKLAWG